jgi:hypothetical protein
LINQYNGRFQALSSILSCGLGHQTGQEAEVLKGLDDGEQVIVYPADTLSDAARITRRAGG